MVISHVTISGSWTLESFEIRLRRFDSRSYAPSSSPPLGAISCVAKSESPIGDQNIDIAIYSYKCLTSEIFVSATMPIRTCQPGTSKSQGHGHSDISASLRRLPPDHMVTFIASQAYHVAPISLYPGPSLPAGRER